MHTRSYRIGFSQWWAALLIAAILHIGIFFSYQKDGDSNLQAESLMDAQEIVIRLKKLTIPPKEPVRVIVENPIPTPPKEVPVKPKPKKIIQPKIQPAQTKPFEPLPKHTEVKQKFEQPRSNDIDKVAQEKIDSSVHNIDQEKISRLRLEYLSQLSAWLEKHKKYPAIARRRQQEGTITVKFVITEQGRLLRHQLLSSSRHASLNKAVEKMLLNASPMPSIPAELRNGKTEFEYTIPVHFKLAKR